MIKYILCIMYIFFREVINMKKNLSLKREQNRLASENAIKDEECYFYDKEYPLVINAQLKIEKIYVIGDEEEKQISEFVEELNKEGKYLLTSTDFNATGKGKISISFGRKTYAQINQDEEIKRIKEMLGMQKSYDIEPIYNPLPDYTNINTYIELDLTRQRVWMYVNGNCILDTPCVTGNVAGGYSTPPGIFHLTYKDTTTYLEGYNSDGSKYKSFVNFWMPFNGGIGFHDASWRSSFGGRIYMTNGSHGCVNLPYAAAQTIYNNINTSMPIILYAS